MAQESTGRERESSGEVLFAGISLGAGALLLSVLVFGVGAEFGAPTIALSVAGVGLLYALRRMFLVVQVLSSHERSSVESESELGIQTESELRQEEKRVLRALKELEFDYELGKLSRPDFEGLRDQYRLRAVELMRRRGDGALQPALKEHIEKLLGTKSEGGEGEAAERESAEESAEESVPRCEACGGENERDARFCKLCGQEIGR